MLNVNSTVMRLNLIPVCISTYLINQNLEHQHGHRLSIFNSRADNPISLSYIQLEGLDEGALVVQCAPTSQIFKPSFRTSLVYNPTNILLTKERFRFDNGHMIKVWEFFNH